MAEGGERKAHPLLDPGYGEKSRDEAQGTA